MRRYSWTDGWGRRTVVLASAALAGLLLWTGCARNDPFDPDTVENSRPTVKFFVGAVDPGDSLNATSYNETRFSWSGTDRDGFVTEFYISIRTDVDEPAPWATTIKTDTIMSFSDFESDDAKVAVYLACRDDRGALSDTLVQYVGIKNFSPVLGLVSDFDPEKNLQREFIDAAGEVTDDGSAAVDTLFWNWGAMTFDMFAYEPDGRETMNTFYRYTLADELPDSTYWAGDPKADPETAWVAMPFADTQPGSPTGLEDFPVFSIFFDDVLPGERTLTVSVKDEANAETLFRYSWIVRAPKGPVLYIPDVSSSATKGFYRDYLDQYFGVGGWDEYSFWKGFPEEDSILSETFRKFDLVLWTDSGTASENLAAAAKGDGLLSKYLPAGPGMDGGRLLLVSRVLTGTRKVLSNPFLITKIGVSPTGSPATQLRMQTGNQALGLQPHLSAFTSTSTSTDAGVGLKLTDSQGEPYLDNEILYRMEECSSCYGDPRRPQPPYDPIVGVRVPSRTTQGLAWLVGISLQLDNFNRTEAFAALDAILSQELGVAP